jgi:hypothetical protein
MTDDSSKSNIDILPIWKRDAPAHERLYELAELARKKPELFQKWVIAYAEDNDKRFKVRTISGTGTRTSDSLAVLQAAILHLWEETKR